MWSSTSASRTSSSATVGNAAPSGSTTSIIGYAFQIEMKYNARKLGFPIAEVPITFVDRELGTSKMSLNIFREAFLGVLQMRRFDIQPVNPDA